MKNSYHHGNLKNELIETAIKIISEEGFDKLSLRNISSRCEVSHAAIYRHFDSKEKLIETCRSFVTEQMTQILENAVEGVDISTAEALKRLSSAYISFYSEHPTYYSFLYRNSSVRLVFSFESTQEDYPPLEIFKRVFRAYGRRINRTDGESLTCLIRLWSLLHGLTALVISKNVEWNGDWQKCLEQEFKDETDNFNR